MAEVSIGAGRCAVYYYDSSVRNWSAADGGISVINLYQNKTTNASRIVAISGKNNQVVINTPVHKDLKYVKASDQFGQFQDAKYMYGLNFATKQESDTFANVVNATVQALSTPVAPPPPAPSMPPEVKHEQTFEMPPRVEEQQDMPSEPEPVPVKAEQPNMMNEMAMKLASRIKNNETTTPTPAPTPTPTPAPAPTSIKIASTPISVKAAIKANEPQPQPVITKAPVKVTSSTPAKSALKDPALVALKEEILQQIREEIISMKVEILEALSRR